MKHQRLDFRQAQAASDLIRLLRARDELQLVRAGGAGFPKIVREQHCRFESDVDAKNYEQLASACLSTSDGAELAVAMIVANGLQGGHWSGNSREFAEMAIARVRCCSRDLRSAILRGLDVIDEFGLGHEATQCFLPRERAD